MKSMIRLGTFLISSTIVTILLSSQAFAQIVVKFDFRVDDGGFVAYPSQPVIQPLPNAGFVVVWVDHRNGNDQIYASIYTHSGEVIRDDYRIDDEPVGSDSRNTGPGSATVDSNGNFFVAYHSLSRGPRLRKFLPNGDPAGPSIDVDLGYYIEPRVQLARGSNDKIIAAFCGYDGSTWGNFYRIFDDNLAPAGPSVMVNQSQIGSQPGLAADPNGNFVVSYFQYLGPGLDGPLIARLYDSTGNPLTNEFVIETGLPTGYQPNIAYNPDGHFMVVWVGASSTAYGRVFDANGVPLSPVIEFAYFDDVDAQTGPPTVAADEAGNFIVVYIYTGNSFEVLPRVILGTTVKSNGQIYLRDYYVTTAPGSDLGLGHIGYGDFAMAYETLAIMPNEGLYVRIFKDDLYLSMTPIAGPGAIMAMIAGIGWIFGRRFRR